MKEKVKSYRFTKQGLNLKVASLGISKTLIKQFLAGIPARHLKRLTAINFIDRLPEGELGHSWESKGAHRNYYAIYYRTEEGSMEIVVYITRDFIREINKNRMWLYVIRRAILHELGHHLVDISGMNQIFIGSRMEDFVDRYTERHSNMKVLFMNSPKAIIEYDKIWDSIEAGV